MCDLTISVAMTAYNNSVYLGMQLESILNQTVFPDEIIICEDHSTDLKVKNVLEEFKKRCPVECRIEYNEKNLGNRLNYQKVYSLCSGDVIIQCDSDDVWTENKIEEIKNVFAKNEDVSLVFHDAIVINENGEEIHDSFYHKMGMLPNMELDQDKFLVNAISKHIFPYGMSMAIRKDILKEILPFYLVQDQWIAFCAPLFGKVAYIDKKLIKYRRHSNNESGNNKLIFSQSKLGKIKETLRNKKEVSRERWFDWVDKTVDDYRIYYNKFQKQLPSNVVPEIEDIILYGETMGKIIRKGHLCGVYNLVKLYKTGLYQKYRGNYSQLILDIVFTI